MEITRVLEKKKNLYFFFILSYGRTKKDRTSVLSISIKIGKKRSMRRNYNGMKIIVRSLSFGSKKSIARCNKCNNSSSSSSIDWISACIETGPLAGTIDLFPCRQF